MKKRRNEKQEKQQADIINELREIMAEYSYSYGDLSLMSGVSSATAYNVLTKTTEPQLSTVIRLANGLNKQVVLEDYEEKQKLFENYSKQTERLNDAMRVVYSMLDYLVAHKRIKTQDKKRIARKLTDVHRRFNQELEIMEDLKKEKGE